MRKDFAFMIYAKIYVEKDADGESVIVFDSSANDEEGYIRRAGKKREGEKVLVVLSTAIYGYEHIAISPEARELFLERLSALPPTSKVLFPADFELGSDGYFSFRPDDIKEAIKRKSNFPDASSCGTARRLRHDEPFRFCTARGSHRRGLYEMIEVDNATLRTLDISTPVDIAELI